MDYCLFYSDIGFSLQNPNFLQPKLLLPSILIINSIFFVLNYATTMILLNYLARNEKSPERK